MQYKYIFSALQCDKFISKFMRACGVGVEDVGIGVQISFLSDKKLTNEQIKKTIEYLESSKDNKELEKYLTSVKLKRIELLGDDKK